MKRTAGAQFNPAQRGLYFQAANPGFFDATGASALGRYALCAVNELDTPAECAALDRMFERGTTILIDSGVFSLAMAHAERHGLSHDEALRAPLEDLDGFGALYERYLSVCRSLGEKAWGYTELDLGGRDQKRETRKKLEAEGLRPIPVYHPLNDGWDYFDELAQEYDRICLGNIVKASRYVRLRLCATIWERKRKYPNLWVHHLGLSLNEWQAALPLDSCDSSTWTSNVRWAQTWQEKSLGRNVGTFGREMIYRYDDPEESYKKAVQLSTVQCMFNNENVNAYLRRAHREGLIDAPDHDLLHH